MVLKCVVKLSKSTFEHFIENVSIFDSDLCKSIKDLSEVGSDNVTIPADLVLPLQKYTSFCIHNFIDPSSFEIIRVVKPNEKNPALIARLEKLRRNEEQRQYDELVANVAKSSKDSVMSGKESIGVELRTLDRQIIGMFNFVLTVAGASVFGYKAPELLWGIDDPLPRLLLAVLCGAIVFIADIYFLIVKGT